jgi:hypothetical protein
MARIFLFTALAAVLTAGCGNGSSDSYDFQLDVPETKTWPATGVLKLAASTPNGAIAVAITGADPISADITRSCKGTDQADAEAHIENVTITDSLAGDTLTIEADMPNPNDRSYNATFDIAAPVLEHMDLDVVNGEITVQDHQGSIDATTSNGAIDCDLATLPGAGWAHLETTNGTITLSVPADVSAGFDVKTINGTVTIIGFGSVDYTPNESTHKAGTLGAGHAEITITISNGDATLQAR